MECCIKFLRFVNILSSMKKILFGCLVVVLFFSCSVDEVEKNSANSQEPVLPEGIEGVLIIEPRLFRDACGYFLESFSEREREFNKQVQNYEMFL